MTKNMGRTDRILRATLVAPLALVIAFVVGAATPLGVVLVIVAAIMLATAAAGFCPLYRLLHLDTRRRHAAP